MLDLTQNAVEAGASNIHIAMQENHEHIHLTIRDDGSGMTPAEQRRALDPFYSQPGKHAHRRVGLGLPFLQQLTEITGARMHLTSCPGTGTTIDLSIPKQHVDTPPTGPLPATLLAMMNYPGDYNLTFERSLNQHHYRVERNELRHALDGLRTAGDLALAKTYLNAQENDVQTRTIHPQHNQE